MNLLFISSEKYPNGGAASNRHLAYTKGLAEAGHNVTFLLLSKQEVNNYENVDGGINFICVPSKKSCHNYNKFKKLYLFIHSIIIRNKIILKIHRQRKIDAIVILDIVVWILLPITYLAKKNNIKIIHERTEYPFVVGGRSLLMKINLEIYLKLALKKIDGIYVISNALKIYFEKLLDNIIPIEIINMVVDPDRFNSISKNRIYNFKYIAYCGSLNDNKDGVDILVKAFADALNERKISSEIKLMLIGPIKDNSFKKKLDNILKDKKCRDNIIFTGSVDRLKVPELLNGASALALARPNSKQAEGGFPTKLGEYLATGKPVIITNVGEIHLFFKDMVNAFIADPGNVHSFSDKIHKVFSDYANALEIGKKGKMLIYNEFNYFKQAEKLAYFIESV